MSKVGESILRGAREALAYAKGQKEAGKAHVVMVPKQIDVRAIRNKLHMSQGEFAANFGFSQRTLEKWEQGIRQPEGAARAYLTVILMNPSVVKTALKEYSLSAASSH